MLQYCKVYFVSLKNKEICVGAIWTFIKLIKFNVYKFCKSLKHKDHIGGTNRYLLKIKNAERLKFQSVFFT